MRWFRRAICIASGLSALLAAAAPASAGVTERTIYYKIGGRTGIEMYQEMNRKGPRHGFLTKAIAQTQFETNLRGDVVFRKGVCRTEGAGFDLTITYVYPQPTQRLSPSMARRWKAFQATNVDHERAHGAIAKKMAAEIDRHMKRFAMKDGKECRRAIAVLGRSIDGIILRYNKAQTDYDAREHRAGGPVEKSILDLVRD